MSKAKKRQNILEPWKGDRRYREIAQRVGELRKAQKQPDEISRMLTEEFGTTLELAELHETPRPCQIYGVVGYDIEQPAVDQIELALRLPIAAAGALMPDAHPGYALPIGGVFAAYAAVAPAMVGVDIGCRMHLTIFDEDVTTFVRRRTPFFSDLRNATVFGTGESRSRRAEHPVLDDPRWQRTNQLRGLKEKAVAQLGTSGSGNHFAELMVGERLDPTSGLLERFCALLTHSGSRGVGFAIAQNYMKLAARETARVARVPKMYEWLSLNSEAGQEYWDAMELAGAFARANHEVIHRDFVRRSKLTPLQVIQNHHNFAWREGNLIIHRKGATPADVGELGIIPGSMGTASYIVEGRGSAAALRSASHGAGRTGSRTQAKNTIALADVRRFLKERDILVEGLSVDEAPQAYKDIERVIEVQVDAGLITPLARMQPIAVIMAGEHGVS